eukprot:9513817-Prorocentrum_lima.AAC.1
MTSSLVGSEMCIRDRLYPAMGADHGLPRLNPLLIGYLAIPSMVLPDSSSTVSYTHLTLPTICSV